MINQDYDREALEFVEQMEPKVLPPEAPYETCLNCRYVIHDGLGTVCRRRAPVAVPDPTGGVFGLVVPRFPPIPTQQWCGEWEQGVP